MKTNNTLFIIISLLLSLTSTSCSSDDSDNGNKAKNQAITPPSWTYGTWKDKEGLYTAKFTSNNLIFGNEGIPIDFSEIANSTKGIYLSEIEKTDTNYKVRLAGSTFHFRKKSDTEIALVLADDPEIPSEWILYKVK